MVKTYLLFVFLVTHFFVALFFYNFEGFQLP